MKIIKGFVSYASLTNNASNTVSSLGELSDISQTYSLDKLVYSKSHDNNTDVATLTVMHSKDSVDSSYFELNYNQTEEIFKIVHFVKTFLRTYPSATFLQIIENLNTEYLGEVSGMQFGPIVIRGTDKLPQWISWISTRNTNNYIRVWLSDTAFKAQYDEFFIKVVPPVDTVSQLFGGYNNVTTLIATQNQDSLYEKISNTRQDKPETILRVLNFNYVNPLNVTQTIPVKWPVLIYGSAGDTLDAIKNALEEYLLTAAPGTTIAQWQVIFPDLFKRTEFIVLPRWDLISVANFSANSSLYRNSMLVQELLTYAKNFLAPTFPATHIDANIETIAVDYKSMSLLVVPGFNNLEGKTRITQMFPDYLAVNTALTDFSRMRQLTQEWVIKLNAALFVANDPTSITILPTGIRHQRKYGKNFVSFMYDNVSYLVATTNT